jgi:hypothetical protein
MRDLHALDALIISKAETTDERESCNLYRLLAFTLPFMVMTFCGVICKNYSVLVASTVGALAGATSFGLYSMIKLTLKYSRSGKPALARIPLRRSINPETLLDG